MGVFDHFPYTNFHELNLEWILLALKEIQQTMEDFVSLNAIKYADPIQWNITRQYEKNTIVIDPLTGTAYISVRPVPSGANITDTDYWTVVFDLGQFVVKMAQNLANVVEPETTLTATVSSSYNDWIIWGDVLYRNINPSGIIAGDAYVIGSNISAFTVEDVVGHIQDLTTSDKSNLVAAINEVLQTLTDTAGDLSDLNTTDKSNLVAAINEVLLTLVTTAGDLSDLNTTDKSNLVAAINEVLLTLSNRCADIETILNNRNIYNVKDYGAVGDGVTDDTDAIKDTITAAHGNGAVYIPSGEYVISDTLTITGGDIVISKGGTLITSVLALEISGNYNVLDGLTIHTSNQSDGIYIHNAFITTINNLNTYGLGTSVRVGNLCYGVSIINANIYNSVNIGIYYNNENASGNSNGLSLIRVNMDSLDLAPQPTIGGIVCKSGEGLYCVNCEIIRQRNGLCLEPITGGGCKYYILSNCIFDLCTDHGVIMKADRGEIFNIALTNCWSSTSGGEGVLLISDGGVIESVNLIGLSCNNNNIGVRVRQISGNIKNVNLNSSSLVSNSAIGDGVHDAIIVEGYTSEISITNNIIDGAIAGYLNNNHSGVNIGANVNNIEVLNNIISGCTSDPIVSSTTGYALIEKNLKAPMPTSVYVPASSMKIGGDAVDTNVSGASSPSCINLLATKDCYASFVFRISKLAAVSGSMYLNLQFMAYGSDTGDIDFKISVGQEYFGSNYTVHTMTKTVNGADPAIIYNIDCGLMPIQSNPNDVVYVTIEREGTDTYQHDIALLSAVVNYLAI